MTPAVHAWGSDLARRLSANLALSRATRARLDHATKKGHQRSVEIFVRDMAKADAEKAELEAELSRYRQAAAQATEGGAA